MSNGRCLGILKIDLRQSYRYREILAEQITQGVRVYIKRGSKFVSINKYSR